MSFRELRETTEILRTLGFPRLVSMENFRYPNFALMAEILEWIVRKFEPNARFPRQQQLTSEQDRVLFVKSAVLTLLQKAHVRLNPKNIYQSDGHAVRELYPVLKMLYEGFKERQRGQQQRPKRTVITAGGQQQQPVDIGEAEEDSVQISALRSQVNAKRQELRQAIQLATELPKSGANLYELLRDEIFAKEVRGKALGHSLNAAQIEKEIRERIQASEERVVEFKQRLENIGNDEQELGRKIERRRRELDQLQKRLAKLQSFRPPYMDEYERYEQELKERYATYVILFRNLHYLQQQLAQVEQQEREQATNAERSMRLTVEKMRIESEQAAPAIAGIQMDLAGAGDDGEERRRHSKEIRVVGNMTGAGLSDDDEEEEEDDENDDGGKGRGGGGRMIDMDEEEEDEENAAIHHGHGGHLLLDDEKFDEDLNHMESEEDEHSANDF